MSCAAYMGEFIHRPNSKLDYKIDWSNWLLDGETIVKSTWTSDQGIGLIDDKILTDLKSTMTYVDGGVVGHTYYVTNTIETITLRESRTLKLVCSR